MQLRFRLKKKENLREALLKESIYVYLFINIVVLLIEGFN